MFTHEGSKNVEPGIGEIITHRDIEDIPGGRLRYVANHQASLPRIEGMTQKPRLPVNIYRHRMRAALNLVFRHCFSSGSWPPAAL